VLKRRLLVIALGASAPCWPAVGADTKVPPEIEVYMKLVSTELEKYQHYPDMARRFRDEGRAVARLMFAKDGQLLDVILIESTGNDRLDRAVIENIRRAAPFPPFPPEIRASKLNFQVPIRFRLK
jgi:periplasmic protein TonB